MTVNTYETGPIRPPSEAGSYLIRITRGCPWNRCGFCVTYKKSKFEIRPVEDVMSDIDAMARVRDLLLAGKRTGGPDDESAWYGVANALSGGGRTAFLQDADSLAAKPGDIRKILAHLKERFPEINRVTTYARSRTLASRTLDDLVSYRELGLTRIHVGMETAHDPLLEKIKKGVTFETHVKGGQNAVAAGMELSEYVMPGLGGKELTHGHAEDTARALNIIKPHFIRLRTLCLHPKMELSAHFGEGGLTRMTDEETVREIREFVNALDLERTTLASDHMLNLLQELEGILPEDKNLLLGIIDRFLSLPERERKLYIVGRRTGLMAALDDLGHPGRRRRAEEILNEIGEENADEYARRATARFM